MRSFSIFSAALAVMIGASLPALSQSSPGGTNGQIQFNNAGNFGGATNVVWAGSALKVGLAATNDFINTWAYGSQPGQVISISSNGSVGGVFAARGSERAAPTTTTIGLMAWGFNDKTDGAQAWALYNECRRYPGTGACFAQEMNVTNLTTDITDIGPYVGSFSISGGGGIPNATVGIWAAAGGDCSYGGNPCYNPATGNDDLTAGASTAAIHILSNGNQFMTGISFAWNALYGNTDSGGSPGNGTAIKMPAGDYIKWMKCSNTSSFPSNCGEDGGAVVGSSVTTGEQLSLVFQNYGFLFAKGSAYCNLLPTTGGPSWSCSSDERLKEDIKPYSGNALAFLDGFSIHDYKVKATGERSIGPIAQEVGVKHPELVLLGENDFLQVEQPGVWLMIAAIQDLHRQIIALWVAVGVLGVFCAGLLWLIYARTQPKSRAIPASASPLYTRNRFSTTYGKSALGA